MKLSKHESHVIRHALGLTRAKDSYRNYFAAGPDDQPIWDALVARGLAKKRDASFVPEPIYVVTEAGRAALNESEGGNER